MVVVACMACLFIGWLTMADDDTSLYLGGLRLEAIQQNDGGWDWPLYDGNPANANLVNNVSPIGMGLARAEWNASDSAFRDALEDAGALLLTKVYNFSPPDGYLATMLDSVFGGTVYRTHVVNNYYAPLAAGTYNRQGSGTLYSTASYVQMFRTQHASEGNLAEWELGMGAAAAVACGADASAWVAGVKAELNEHDSDDYYDVLGLAAALYGLAKAGEDFDPTTGDLASAGSLVDLADILAGYQITTGSGAGGFTWQCNYVAPNEGHETVQETGHAILALNEIDRAKYLGVIQSASDWLIAFQLVTGGWQNYLGLGENNQRTGEAMWGIHAVYLSDVWVAPGGVDSGFGFGFAPFATIQKAVDTIEGLDGTIHVAAGTYAGDLAFSAGATTLVSDSGAGSTSIQGSVLLDSVNVLLGRLGQGFTINGPISVGAGVDASTIHINWNDIFDVVSNLGLHTLDATFNYWGEDGPDTVGKVAIFPMLPDSSDIIIGYMTDLGLSALNAINFANLLAQNLSEREALVAIELMSTFGFNEDELGGILDDYGYVAVDRALRLSGGDYNSFLVHLLGYLVDAPIVGGGTEGEIEVYATGDLASLTIKLINPITGDVADDALVSYTICRTLGDGTPEIVGFGVLSFDADQGTYVYDIDTTGLAPGVYDIFLGPNDGRVHHFQIELVEG
jgi:hypothetical protein